jgi:hypothetical protein
MVMTAPGSDSTNSSESTEPKRSFPDRNTNNVAAGWILLSNLGSIGGVGRFLALILSIISSLSVQSLFLLAATVFIQVCSAETELNAGFQIASGVQGIGLDLIALIVSDAGIASEKPEWWNASPRGCILLGLQPRGGWQVMQRATQWGNDLVSRAFGIKCSSADLYAYFACSLRNRLEVWNCGNFVSPMEGQTTASAPWKAVGECQVQRPTKLVDGSRGGQAFMCKLLLPKEGSHYGIDEQARMQLLSVILVAAGLSSSRGTFKADFQEEFGFSAGLGVVFYSLARWLALGAILSIAFATSVWFALSSRNFYGAGLPFAIQLSSLFLWIVGATAMFMLGGNPRVQIVDKAIPAYIEARLPKPPYYTSEKDKTIKDLEVEFGSFHGSLYTGDRGSCKLPPHLVRSICKWDLKVHRKRSWFLGIIFFGGILLFSIATRVGGLGTANLWSETLGLLVLLSTSVSRGFGTSGDEAWMIPKKFRRANASYGAVLVGSVSSRSA